MPQGTLRFTSALWRGWQQYSPPLLLEKKGGEGDSGQPLTISPQYWYRARTEVRWLSGLYEQELDHVFVRPHSIGVGASLKHIFCNGVRVRQFDKEH